MEPKYSGDASKEFWDSVNATDDMTLYIFGCALQDLEGRVLQALDRLAKKPPKTLSTGTTAGRTVTRIDAVATTGGKLTLERKDRA